MTYVSVTPGRYTRGTFDPSRYQGLQKAPRKVPSSKSARMDWCWTSRA